MRFVLAAAVISGLVASGVSAHTLEARQSSFPCKSNVLFSTFYISPFSCHEQHAPPFAYLVPTLVDAQRLTLHAYAKTRHL